MNQKYGFVFLAIFLVILGGCSQKLGNNTDENVVNSDNSDNIKKDNLVSADISNSKDSEVKTEPKSIQSSELTINVLARGPKDDAWSFEPSEIKVKQGTKVKLVITIPEDDVDHAISIPEFNVNKVMLKKGTTETVEFTADKQGEFSFFCSLFCGEGHRNMKGKIIVE